MYVPNPVGLCPCCMEPWNGHKPQDWEMHLSQVEAAARKFEEDGSVMDFLGFTLLFGFGGGLALVMGHRRTAGSLWLALGAGTIGALFDRWTNGALRFGAVRAPTKAEVDLLVSHIPFLILGLLLIFGVGGHHDET